MCGLDVHFAERAARIMHGCAGWNRDSEAESSQIEAASWSCCPSHRRQLASGVYQYMKSLRVEFYVWLLCVQRLTPELADNL